MSYNNSEDAVRDALESQYQKLIEDVQYQYSDEMSEYKRILGSLKNFKYLLLILRKYPRNGKVDT